MAHAATLYIGTYSVRGSEGIYRVQIDLATGAMRALGHTAAADASYLALAPNGRALYAVDESVSNEERNPAVAAYDVHSDGSLSVRGKLAIPGLAPCHIAVSPDSRWLVTSNYTDGSHTIVSIGDNSGVSHVAGQSVNSGSLGPHSRQDAPHAHSAFFAGSDKPWRVLTCDLGLDQVMVFEMDPESGVFEPASGSAAALPPGAGPRHLAFHPSLPMVYVLGELDSAVHAFRMTTGDMGSISLNLEQSTAALPPDFHGESFGAAIRVSPDGGTVIASNRGHDSLTSFRIDLETGLLAPLGNVPCGGQWPRDFAYVGRDLLVVANERSDTLAAFRIGQDGAPDAIDLPEARLTVPSPVCVVERPSRG